MIHNKLFICFSATMLVNAKAARRVEISEQITMLTKSGEGKEEAVILSQRIAPITCMDTTPPASADIDDKVCQPEILPESLSIQIDEKADSAPEECREKTAAHDSEHGPADVDRELEKSDIVDKLHVQTENTRMADMVTPRSENSQTESQIDEVSKDGKRDAEGVERKEAGKHLDRIMEEQNQVGVVWCIVFYIDQHLETGKFTF